MYAFNLHFTAHKWTASLLDYILGLQTIFKNYFLRNIFGVSCSLMINIHLYPGFFSLRVMFALLHLQTCLPRLQFALTRLCTKGIAENMLRCSPSSLWSYFNQRFEFSQTASTFRLSFFLKTLLKNRFEGLLSSYMNTIGFRRNNIKKYTK